MIDFVRGWSERTEIAAQRFIRWLGVASSKFYDWRARYGKVNEHNGWIPRDFWLEEWEKQAIVDVGRHSYVMDDTRFRAPHCTSQSRA